MSFETNIKEILVHEIVIENDFKAGSYLELYESILCQYNTLKIAYYILKERYEILNQADNILINFWFHPVRKGFISKYFHIFKNIYYYKIKNDINYLKIRLYLERITTTNGVKFSVNLTNEFQSNFINIEYLKYINV